MRRGYEASGVVNVNKPLPRNFPTAKKEAPVVKKEEPLSYGYSLADDCWCENNSPECPECWWSPPAGTNPDPINGYGMKSTFSNDVTLRFQECEALLLRKHKDYGPSNIGDAPGGALNGLRVRMHDKLARINHLIDNGAQPQNESLRDSLADLCNYSLIGLMVIDDVWPKE